MGLFKKLFKGVKKAVKGIAKGIKKVASSVKKVTKKVWSGIKKVGGKVMRAVNKAGILGQIGLMVLMPYAFNAVGSLIGGAAGGISATWSGLGNWSAQMMGGSSAFAKTVGHIANGIYQGGAMLGRAVQGVSSFVSNGFASVAEATGLPNPIEGFSEAVKNGYSKGVDWTNQTFNLKLKPEQLEAAGVVEAPPVVTTADTTTDTTVEPPVEDKGFLERTKEQFKAQLPGRTAKVAIDYMADQAYEALGMGQEYDQQYYGVGGKSFSELRDPSEYINFFQQRGDNVTPNVLAYQEEVTSGVLGDVGYAGYVRDQVARSPLTSPSYA
jgi:hypothetical protein